MQSAQIQRYIQGAFNPLNAYVRDASRPASDKKIVVDFTAFTPETPLVNPPNTEAVSTAIFCSKVGQPAHGESRFSPVFQINFPIPSPSNYTVTLCPNESLPTFQTRVQ